MAYARQQEEQADRAGVNFLTLSGQSAKGMYDTFKRFADQQLFSSQYADPYIQSHPMPAERIAALAEVARANPYWDKKDPPELQQRHDLTRAKLFGYLDRPDTLARRYPMSDNSLPARYARAVSNYRHADLRTAITQIDALIQVQPNNPYFYELKGQALVDSGRGQEALSPLRRSIALAPDPTLIRVLLGQALVSTNDPNLVEEAVTNLRLALQTDSEIPDAYDHLAIAFRPQGRSRRRRSRLRPGGFQPRQPADRPSTCQSRQDPISDRIARMGQGGRHRELQTAATPTLVSLIRNKD